LPSQIQPGAAGKREINQYWLLLPLVILLVSRIIPFLHWPGVVPLGADAAAYLHNFESCFSNPSRNDCLSSPEITISNLLQLAGWSINGVLYGFYILSVVFVGLAVYLVTKEYFDRKAAITSLIIFSLSSSQFLAYFAFYWKMMLAMGLTLVSFYLIKKKTYLVIPVAGLMGSLHPLSFLPFGLAMIAQFIFGQNKKFIFISGTGILLIAFSINWQEFTNWLPYYTTSLGITKNFPTDLTEVFIGHFVNFSYYRQLILIYLPFAIINLVQIIWKRQANLIVFYFLANLLIIILNFIFHNRFIVLLDLAAIILAGRPVLDFINSLRWTWAGRLIISLLIFGLVTSFSYQLWSIEPFITDPEEINELKSLALTEKNSIALTNNRLYLPFLNAYSQRSVIELPLTRNNLVSYYSILDTYQQPIYLHLGEKTENNPELKNNRLFKQVSKHIWQYQGGNKK